MGSPKPRFAATNLAAEDSIQRIREAVAKYGVRHFSVRYEDGRPVGVSIVALSDQLGEVPIMLEVAAEALRDRMYTEKARTSPADQIERAYDVGWRQVLAYVEVMLEFVESGERSIEEAFMADMGVQVDGTFRRLADVVREQGQLALPAGAVVDSEAEVLD